MLPAAAVSALTARAGVRLLTPGPGGLVAAADLNGGLTLYADRAEAWRQTEFDADTKTRYSARITDLAFDSEGELLVAVGSHGVSAYDIATGHEAWSRRRRWMLGFLSDLPLTVCAGGDNDFVVSWASGRVERMDHNGRLLRAWSDNSAPQSMAYLAEQRAIVGADGYSLRLWDATVWPPLERQSLIGRWVKVLAAPSKEILLARRLDAMFALSPDTLEVIWSVPGPGSHPSMAVNPAGTLVAWVDGAEVAAHDAHDGSLVMRHETSARPLCVAADEAGFIVGLADGTVEDFTV